MPTIQQIKELISAFGWVDLGDQKNVYMISYRHEEDDRRMNIYFTTMTVTIQNGSFKSYKNVTLSELEDILIS